MKTSEHAPVVEELPNFGMEIGMDEFDINAAFQEALQDVVTDDELALEEKVRRMELIVNEGASELYRDFVDFRAMAAHMEMMCNHDHDLDESVQGNETLSSFMGSHKAERSRDHRGNHDHKDEEEFEIDPKTGKKKKRKRYSGWLKILLGN